MNEKILYAANMLASRLWRSHISPDKIQEIAVVKWDEIGDMTAAVHVFDLLKTYAPSARITVLCKPFVGSLISEDPAVYKVVHDAHELPQKVDVWIELRGTWRTFWMSLFRTKYVRLDRGRVRFQQRGKQAHERITNFRIIEPLVGSVNWSLKPLHLAQTHKEEAAQCIQNILGLPVFDWNAQTASKGRMPFVVVHPGGRSSLRRWPTTRFAEVIRSLFAEKGWQALVLGTPSEQELVAAIVKDAGGAAKAWISESSLSTLAAVMSRAQLFIGNESGPLQIADAMGLPSVAIFGPGVPNVFYPQTPGSQIFHHVLSCNPCDQVSCVRPENPCVNLVQTQEVIAAVRHILASH